MDDNHTDKYERQKFAIKMSSTIINKETENTIEMCSDMDEAWCDMLDVLSDNIYNEIVNLFQQIDSALLLE